MSVAALSEHLRRALPKAVLKGKWIDLTCYQAKIVLSDYVLCKIEAHSVTQAIAGVQEWLNKLTEAME